jgi:tRNA U34 2-thiouridine synthase MnmA/TrmU
MYIYLRWTEDMEYASAVANKLNVPLEAIPMQKEYFELVTNEAIREVI